MKNLAIPFPMNFQENLTPGPRFHSEKWDFMIQP
jgi:hypothetical protein